ncbi:MAG: septum formation initiator family protein [Oscillospiraceae bacterium]|nr:septum formation initiator family protein [Oscillospiraceae bacterium]
MKRGRKPKRRWLSKLVILVFAVWSVMIMISVQGRLNTEKAKKDELAIQKTALELNIEILKDTESEDPAQSYERIAREKLGLVYPDEIIIIDKTP